MYSVSMANELIREIIPADSRSCLVLSPMEFRIKYLLVSLIQENTFEFDAIDISAAEFAKYFDLKWGGEQSKSLKISMENLTESRYILDGNIIRWLSPESCFSGGNIHLKLDDSLVPYLLQLENYFTLYNYDSVAKFASKYSYRLYEFLKSAEGMGFYKIGLNDAIALLGDGCCKTKAEFINRVLTPALKDINTHSDIRIRKRFHKPFGKPEQIWFSIRNKADETPQENIIYNSKSAEFKSRTPIRDENLTPVDVDVDDKLRSLVTQAKQERFHTSKKTKPCRFNGRAQS